MFIEKWMVALVLIALLLKMGVVWMMRKQIRALRFCFLHFSDAIKNEIDEAAAEPNGSTVGGVLRGLNRVWGQELDWARKVMARAHLKWFSDTDKLFALEN